MKSEILNEDGVRALYRRHLGRDVESQEVLEAHLKGHQSLQSLQACILNSPEYLAKNQLPDIWSFLPRNLIRPAPVIDVDVTPSELAAIFQRIAGEWSKLGETDAHWSVITSENYRHANFEKHEQDFYNSGKHLASVIEVFAKRNGVQIARDHVLELGCGTGRVTAALADSFGKVTAVDVSAGHLRLCRTAMEKRGIYNVSFEQLASPAGVDDLPNCSFFLSTIVLQHNPPPLIGHLLDRLLAKVLPGGAALFQVPTHTPGYEFQIKKYLGSKKPSDFEMHCFPMNRVFQLLQDHGFRVHEVIMDTWTGMPGSHTFFASKSQ